MVRALPLSRGGTRASGVTLLEILVAVAVLAVGLSTIFQIFPMGFAASAKSSAQTTAYELAARKLEDVRTNHLFGGIPTDTDMYWGSLNAPNPDGNAFAAVNTDKAFRAFPGDKVPERNFFYRIHCIPVVDPPPPRVALTDLRPPKYLEYPHRLNPASTSTWANQWRGFATMYRVTVTVRGPLKNLAEAQDDQWANSLSRKGAIEVKLVTYVANKKLGDALLAIDPNCAYENSSLTPPLAAYGPEGVHSKPIRDGDFTAGPSSPATRTLGADFIHIVGPDGGNPFPENFTVLDFNTLTPTERNDTGPTVVVKVGGVGVPQNRTTYLSSGYHIPQKSHQMWGSGLNRTGMDNVLIVYEYSPGKFIAESNKIVAIHPPGTYNDAFVYGTSNELWRLDLYNPLIASDGDFRGRHGSGDDTNGLSSRLIDNTWDSDSALRGTGSKYGYPAWKDGSAPLKCTRVRFLMRLEKWPR
ncbi:MAG: hypothetical protein GX934_13820 [Burkholderiales bacterium]|nr:hypothetical protein [Burkholderiales bacterium]